MTVQAVEMTVPSRITTGEMTLSWDELAHASDRGDKMKIVLTGGPSAGKTSLALVLSKTYSDQVTIVPEAASILFAGGFPRSPEPEQKKCQQKAIYYVQQELEQVVTLESVGRSLICDRGSLDALAYWPGTEDEFLRAINSSMEKEIARYQWVMHLETASSPDYKASAIRTETSAQATEINERVKYAWRAHPNRIIIPNSSSFPTKIHLAIKIVRAILDNRDCHYVRELVELERAKV